MTSSLKSNSIVDVVMWPKFCNSRISMRKVITISILWGFDLTISILWGFDQKNHFFGRWSWFKFNNLGLVLGRNLQFYTSVAKRLKLKLRKFWGLIPTFVEIIGKKLVGGAFLPPPILNRVKINIFMAVQYNYPFPLHKPPGS